MQFYASAALTAEVRRPAPAGDTVSSPAVSLLSDLQCAAPQVLAHSVNGTTYTGIRGRTTGAPQNHWFGPCGDPRGAGIGTPEVAPPL